jgi:hypothetical protein
MAGAKGILVIGSDVGTMRTRASPGAIGVAVTNYLLRTDKMVMRLTAKRTVSSFSWRVQSSTTLSLLLE